MDTHNDKSTSLSQDTTGDGAWSTPPTTPTVHQKSVNNQGSYHEAMLNSDFSWNLQDGSTNSSTTHRTPITDVRDTAPPKHIVSTPPGKTPTVRSSSHNPNMAAEIPNMPLIALSNSSKERNPNRVVSRPGKIHMGFSPPLETTNPVDLPGSRDGVQKVITEPPHSQKSPISPLTKSGGNTGTRQRAESIEEADRFREAYVPDFSGGDGGEVEAVCLDFTSLLIGKDRSDSDSGHESLRKASCTPSEISTISLPGSFHDPSTLDSDFYGNEVYSEMLKASPCYSIIPSSTKIVVFDTRLRVKKAFFALVANGIRAAPLWDSGRQEFVGMLTITDFINILRQHYKSPIVGMDELENESIQQWRDSEKKVASVKSTLLRIDPEESLYEAVKMLVVHKIHRLPIIDSKTGNALHILTHKKLLNYMFNQLTKDNQPPYMDKSLEELGIGTYTNVAMASPDTPIIKALNIFHESRVSALPIVDMEGKVVDIYAKFDVINLAAERTYNNLDVTIKEALLHRSQGFEGVHTCKPYESLYTIVKRLATTKMHRLVIVDDHNHVKGVVSLSDILKYLVLTTHSRHS